MSFVNAFEKAGYDRDLGRVSLSNRPDLCEYQCNGAMAGAKKYKVYRATAKNGTYNIAIYTVESVDNNQYLLNADGTTNKYTIEDREGKQRVNARSLIGVIYALTEFNDEMYLVNESSDDELSYIFDKYRV